MIQEINYISKQQVTVTSLQDFINILQDLKINDNNVEKYIGKYAFIEIGSSENNIQAELTTFPKDGYNETNWRNFYIDEQYYFKSNHINVIRLEFDDIVTPVKKTDNGYKKINTSKTEEGVPQNPHSIFKNHKGFKYQNPKFFDDNLGRKLITFINKNINKNKNVKFIIHCRQGASRSAAIGTFIMDYLKYDLDEFYNEYKTDNNSHQFRIGLNRKGKNNPETAYSTYPNSLVLDTLSNLNNINSKELKQKIFNYSKNNNIDRYKKQDMDKKISETIRKVLKEYITEDVAINQIDNEKKIANLTYNTGKIKNNLKKTDYLTTDLMDKTNNSKTIEVRLKGGLVSYNITGIKGTEVMHYFKNHFQHKDNSIKIGDDDYKLKMKENEFNQFMQVFKEKIETVIENDMLKQTKKEQKKNKDFQFTQISIYPIPSSSNFNEKIAQELSHLTINCNQKSYKINILNKNILLKDLKNVTTDDDFIKANKEYYYDTPFGKNVDTDNMFYSPAIAHINMAIIKNQIIFNKNAKLINEINKIYFQIYNIINRPKFNTDSLANLIAEYLQKHRELIKNDNFKYNDERYLQNKSTYIRSQDRFKIDEKNDLLTPQHYDILEKIREKYNIKGNVDKIKPLQLLKFQIKSLPNSVRMGLKNIYIPNENEEMQEELNKVQSNLIVVFDDNISGGATLSDVCYQLYKLGAQHIIPITFGQMAKKTYTKNGKKNIILNEPTNGKFKMPKYKF